MGYGMYFQININKMLAAVKVGKTLEEIAVMEKNYREKFNAGGGFNGGEANEKNYRLLMWCCKVREGQKMLNKGWYKDRAYQIVAQAIKEKEAQKVLTTV